MRQNPPALLLDALMTAPQLMELSGGSGATVRRNLDLLAQRGLVREVTGLGRFRVWAVRERLAV